MTAIPVERLSQKVNAHYTCKDSTEHNKMFVTDRHDPKYANNIWQLQIFIYIYNENYKMNF